MVSASAYPLHRPTRVHRSGCGKRIVQPHLATASHQVLEGARRVDTGSCAEPDEPAGTGRTTCGRAQHDHHAKGRDNRPSSPGRQPERHLAMHPLSDEPISYTSLILRHAVQPTTDPLARLTGVFVVDGILLWMRGYLTSAFQGGAEGRRRVMFLLFATLWPVTMVSARGDALHCSVADDGRGFNTATWDNVRKGHHMGIDATAARVHVAGGTFAIESEVGKGTHASFSLPLDSQHPPEPSVSSWPVSADHGSAERFDDGHSDVPPSGRSLAVRPRIP